MQSDELATSRTNQPPSWSRQQGPSYFGQFLKMMMGFMARTGLYLFVFPNIADMPRDVPTDKEELRTFKGAYEIETKAAFRLSNIKAWGYLQWIPGHARLYWCAHLDRGVHRRQRERSALLDAHDRHAENLLGH